MRPCGLAPGLSQEVCVDRASAPARERKCTQKYLDSGYVHVYEHDHVHVQGAVFRSLRYGLSRAGSIQNLPTSP